MLEWISESFLKMADELRHNIQRLQSFGLNNREADITAELIGAESVSVSDLSRFTRIPRSSIYRYLDELEEKGVIEWVLSPQGRRVKLASLEFFRSQIKDDIKKVKAREKELTNFIQRIEQPEERGRIQPVVRYYEGKSGIRQLIWNTLSAKGPTRVYTNAVRREIVGRKWFVNYLLEFVNRNHSAKVLGDYDYARNSYQKYGSRNKYFAPVRSFVETTQERIIPSKLLEIKGETYIYNNIVASYSWEGKKLVGSEIESEYIFRTQKSIFDFLWSTTTEKDSIEKYL